MRYRVGYLKRRGRLLPDRFDLGPPAFKVRAKKGWRVVWVDWVEPDDGTIELHPTVGVHVFVVTYWGVEAPQVYPSGNDPTAIVSTLGQGAAVVPLFGPRGERLPRRARVFLIAPPYYESSDQNLRDRCWEWLRRDFAKRREEMRRAAKAKRAKAKK